MAQNIDKDAVLAKLDNNTSSEKPFMERMSEFSQKLKEKACLEVEVSKLEDKLKKQDAKHKAEVDNLRAEIAKLKSSKQKSTAPVTELHSENEKPSHSALLSKQHPVCYKQSQNIIAELENTLHNCKNLEDKVSELGRKINEQTQLATLVAELQRKVEQSNLATKVSDLQYKIDKQSYYMEGRILKLERQNQKNHLVARVSELDRRVEELTHLTTQVSKVERESDDRNTVSELSLLQLSEKINDLQIKSEEISQQIQSVIGKQGCEEKVQINNEPVATQSDDECYYHVRFGEDANKCVQPCKYYLNYICNKCLIQLQNQN